MKKYSVVITIPKDIIGMVIITELETLSLLLTWLLFRPVNIQTHVSLQII